MKKPETFSHEFVPSHEVMSKKDKEELLARLSVTIAQLPRIKKSDPALAGLNVDAGDIIKITRSDSKADTAENLYYRYVVK